jgi:anti-sigma B factor antagonist
MSLVRLPIAGAANRAALSEVRVSLTAIEFLIGLVPAHVGGGVGVAVSVSTTREDGVGTVTVTGELDLASGDGVTRAIGQEITAPDTTAVLVDLSALTFLDSSGISVLVKGRREADKTGVSYRVTGVTGMVRQVLSLTGLLEHLCGESSTETRE